MTSEERIQQLQQSHDQLRGALVAAGLIRKFRHNPDNPKMLHLLRRALREARIVRRNELHSQPCTAVVPELTPKI